MKKTFIFLLIVLTFLYPLKSFSKEQKNPFEPRYEFNTPEIFKKIDLFFEENGLNKTASISDNTSDFNKFYIHAREIIDCASKKNYCKPCELLYDIEGNPQKTILTWGTKAFTHPNGFLLITFSRLCFKDPNKKDYIGMSFLAYNKKAKLIAKFILQEGLVEEYHFLSTRKEWGRGGELKMYAVPLSFAKEFEDEIITFNENKTLNKTITQYNISYSRNLIPYQRRGWELGYFLFPSALRSPNVLFNAPLENFFIDYVVRAKNKNLHPIFSSDIARNFEIQNKEKISKYVTLYEKIRHIPPEIFNIAKFFVDFLKTEKIPYKIKKIIELDEVDEEEISTTLEVEIE